MKISSMTGVSEPSYNGVQFYTICQTRPKESLYVGFCSAQLADIVEHIFLRISD